MNILIYDFDFFNSRLFQEFIEENNSTVFIANSLQDLSRILEKYSIEYAFLGSKVLANKNILYNNKDLSHFYFFGNETNENFTIHKTITSDFIDEIKKQINKTKN